MKFSKLSQLFLVSSIGLTVATLLTACQLVTVDYVFVAADSGIYTYAVDSQSGALRTGAKAVTSGVNSPVTMTVSADYQNLYLANGGNKSVTHYTVASNGVVTVAESVTLAAAPTALTVNAAGTYLYVTYNSPAATLAVYPLSGGKIGSLATTQVLALTDNPTDTLIPTGIASQANNKAVFVTAYDKSAYNPGGTTTSTANSGWVFSFSTSTGGALVAGAGSPYEAGVKPSAIAAEPANRFVYVTDFANNQMIAYSINNISTMSFLRDGPYKTGNQPSAITIDPRGKFIYVANELDSTVSAYTINLVTGSPSTAVNTSGGAANATDTQPVGIVVDPSEGRYVYTANFLGNSASGFRLDTTAGTLQQTLANPYPTGQHPVAIAIVPHGNHSLQTISY